MKEYKKHTFFLDIDKKISNFISSGKNTNNFDGNSLAYDTNREYDVVDYYNNEPLNGTNWS